MPCLLTEARIACEQGDQAHGDDRLREAPALGKRLDSVAQVFSLGSRSVAKLSTRALKTMIEIDGVQQRIHRADLAPLNPHAASEALPWPIRVYTLGRFAVQIYNKAVQFDGKAQRKPLELLKALIAFGSQDVRVERLTDCLWPDAQGDAAADVLKTTLHRLRKLLQNNEALRLNDRHLSLDKRCIWVDSLVFDHISHQAKALDAAALEHALRIYGGPFLDGDSTPWALGYRERLRAGYLVAAERLGTLLENAGGWSAAAETYEKAVEMEPAAETLYRRLMSSYLQLGRRTEALTVYRRCDLALQTHLGIKPTRETQALYQSILDG